MMKYIFRFGNLKIWSTFVSVGTRRPLGLSGDLLILRCPPRALPLSLSRRFPPSLLLDINRYCCRLPCRRRVHGIMRPLPNFAMCELCIVSPHRFHRDGAITARALNGPGPATVAFPSPAPRSTTLRDGVAHAKTDFLS